MEILVVDDHREMRIVLGNILKQLGHTAVFAEDGRSALSKLESSSINLVISDWMMPTVSGVELCKSIRSKGFGRYIYFILLTALSTKEQVVEGMEAGADDYITKPFMMHELKLRINAGLRVLELEKELEKKNTNLQEANSKLNESLSLIRQELEFAGSLQKDLIPETGTKLGDYKFDWLLLPCLYTAGDIFSYYYLDESHILFYELDVAGHGAASAMLSYSLSKFISGLFETCNLSNQFNGHETNAFHEHLWHPKNILSLLNTQFLKQKDAMHYFTICIGIIDLDEHRIRICRAGHPLPIVLRKNGETELLNQRGFPVGMLVEAEYNEVDLVLDPGDRLIIYSDGLLEGLPKEHHEEKEIFLNSYVYDNKSASSEVLLANLKAEVFKNYDENNLKDDISVLIIERT